MLDTQTTPQKPAAFSLALLGCTGFIVVADQRIINPLLPILAHEFHTDIGSAGSIVTAYTIPYGLFQLFYGPLGDRIGKERVMVAAMGTFAIGTVACAFAQSLVVLDLLRFATGAVAAAIFPLALAYVGDHFVYAERQRAVSSLLGAAALGTIMSTSMGGIVADFLTWRAIFCAYGLISLAVFILLWRASRTAHEILRAPDGQRWSLKPYLRLIATPGPRLILLGVFAEGLFFFGAFAYLGAYLRDRFQLLYVIIGLILATYGIGNLLFSRTSRWLVRLLGERVEILIGGLTLSATLIGVAFLQNWPLFIPLLVLMGFGYGLIHTTLQTKATELTPNSRGTAVSLFAFSFFIGQGLGASFLGAVLTDTSYQWMFLIAGAPITLLALWLAWRLPRGLPRSTDNEVAAEPSPVMIAD